MSGHSRQASGARASSAAWLGLALALGGIAPGAGCAQPYSGPRTAAAIALSVLGTSAALWVAGERADNRVLANVGAVGTAAGVVASAAAGVWMAGAASCQVDPDCPEDEVCREIPAPPDREPFRQCSPR